jgi:hypothetical protein
LGDIFREIEEDLRRDRWQAVWKRYGIYVVGAAIAIVAATAAWVGWQHYQQREAIAVTQALYNAMGVERTGETQQAIDAFAAVSAEGNARQAALALFQEAALRAKSGDIESARGIYQSLRENSSLDAPYHALATIRAVELDLETGDPEAMLKWLEPLSTDASPWRHTAWELGAFLEKRRNNTEAARILFERLRDDAGTPVSAQARAEAYLAQM